MKIAHLVLSNVYAGIEQHVNELILEQQKECEVILICNGEIEKNSGEWTDDLIRYDNGKKIVEKAKTFFKVLDKD